MSIRLAIMLSGSLLVGAAGGVIAGLPMMMAANDGGAVIEQAPTPQLDESRRIVLASLESSRDEVSRRLAELELLADLMASTAGWPTPASATGQGITLAR